MQASRARWALVILSMLGLTGCQSGKSWWPSRNKLAYSTASKTPPAGASQNQLPSAQQSPYGAETQPDANQYAQQTGGYAGNPADPYGANNYMAPGADPYAGQTAGATPQNGPYNADGYQQPAGGAGGYGGNGYGAGGYGGAANGNYAGGQVTNPYVGGAAGGQGYNDYQSQQQGGYGTQQTAGGYNPAGYQGGATDPAASQAPYTADARSNYGQPQANYNAPSQYAGSGGAGYGANAAMPEQSPYGAPGDPAYGQGAGAPGNTGYQPGNTGYNPQGVPPYQSPGGNYNSDPNAGASEPRYRPGGTSDYSPAGGTGAGAGGAGSGAAAYDNGRYGNSGAANSGAANSGYNDAGTASPSRYPTSTPTSGYPNPGGADRYAQPSSSTAGSGAYENYLPQR